MAKKKRRKSVDITALPKVYPRGPSCSLRGIPGLDAYKPARAVDWREKS